MKIDSSGRTWFTGNSSCGGYKFDLESIMTHEMGHVFGQNHVAESRATMNGSTPACRTYQRTLGKGDRFGLYALYPSATPE